MIDFIVHDNEGRILRSGLCQKEAVHLQATRGEVAIVGKACDEKHYILSGKVTERPLFDTAVVGLTITNIPESTEVYVDGEMLGVCESGVLSIDKPNGVDRYQLKLVNFPYIDHEVML